MGNPIFEQYQNNGVRGGSLMDAVSRLKSQLGGDPNTHIQQLLNSGRISQEQYNRAVEQANRLRGVFR